MARNGKIARLPATTRHELNVRLRDGEPGQPLLDWLNGLPETKEMLEAWFAGAAISRQNLSEWRLGGHQEWLRHEEARLLVRELVEQGQELESDADGQEVSDAVGIRVAVELAQAVASLAAETDAKERWGRLKEVLPHLAALRRADHRARRLRLERERLERERDERNRLDQKRIDAEVKRETMAPILSALMQGWLAQSLGGGKAATRAAESLAALHHDLPVPEAEEREAESPGGSDPVKPRQTKKSEPAPVTPSQSHPDSAGPCQPAHGHEMVSG